MAERVALRQRLAAATERDQALGETGRHQRLGGDPLATLLCFGILIEIVKHSVDIDP